MNQPVTDELFYLGNRFQAYAVMCERTAVRQSDKHNYAGALELQTEAKTWRRAAEYIKERMEKLKAKSPNSAQAG